MVNALARWPVILLVVLLSPAVSFSQQQTWGARFGGPGARPEKPLPDGQRLTASDGDTVVIDGDARVRVVRRHPAFVRMIADAERRFVVVIAEHLAAQGDTPTRLSDKAYTVSAVEGQWPLTPRWEGTAWLEEEMSLDGFGGVGGLRVETAQGTIRFGRRGPPGDSRPDADSTTLSFMGIGISGAALPKRSFDEVERQQVANAIQSAARNGAMMRGSIGSGGIGFRSEIITRGTDGSNPAAPAGAVRVGGNVAPPEKIRDVQPQLPAEARAARVSGVVILEITIGVDGSVIDARVLRSIPLLDQAALDAVRQWKYAPPVVNGSPVPVIMTVTVSFGAM